uniref:FGFR1 oncogene partner 2 isoform X1 n=1 Tax=Myxine glutinosa TaxID=7769 RepID=UPI00359015E9
MACTIEKVLADAKVLVERLKEHDSVAESLIEQTSALNKRVEAMKEYQEEVVELNEVARHRPHSALVLGIQQENRQIRELQQENKELLMSLDEHQSALELIMTKYREQMVSLLTSNKSEDSKIVGTLQELHNKKLAAKQLCARSRSIVLQRKSRLVTTYFEELHEHVQKVCEMAAVMKRAIEIDDAHVVGDRQKLAQLELENRTLRELLKISRETYLNGLGEDGQQDKPGD